MSKIKIAPQRLILTLLFVGFLIYAVITMVSQASQVSEGKQTIKVQEQQIAQEQRRALELDEETSKIGTDEFVEKQAKEKLGYVKSNEKIFYDKAQ